LTTATALNKDSIVVQYWYWDPFGQLITYRKFDNRGRRKLEIQVDNPNLANEYRLARIPSGDTFSVAHFRHNQPWRSMHFNGTKASYIGKAASIKSPFTPMAAVK
ncbi:MAG: hypothetical protein RLZZ519_1380, partial [Bacteroidota bacterium]